MPLRRISSEKIRRDATRRRRSRRRVAGFKLLSRNEIRQKLQTFFVAFILLATILATPQHARKPDFLANSVTFRR